MLNLALRLLLLLSVLLGGVFAPAQKKGSAKAEPKPTTTAVTDDKSASASPDAKKEKPEDLDFKGMKYRSIGPFRGGRSLTVAGINGDPSTYWLGSTGGGVWKSVDGAMTWSPTFDKQGVGSIGSLAVSQSDPNVVYVGTGEACIRGNISHGDGIYKTIDGGKNWKNIGLKDSRAIGKVIVHPRDPDIVFVAALGHPYGPNAERGIFRTTDGGKTWEKVLFKDEDTGGIDVAFDPRNPNIVYAALWQARRTPYSLSSGGPGSGLYKSIDAGSTWKRLEGKDSGLPEGIYGRIGVSVAANSDRVYALIEAAKGGLYRSDDGGEKWQLVDGDRKLQQRAWYYMHVFADPQDVNTVYVLEVDFHKSTDGGRTFNDVTAPHGDNHSLWIDPSDPRRMVVGNDGGAMITLDEGKNWTSPLNQPTAQFYHVITDNRFPYYVYGAQQDNSTIAIASRGDEGKIDRADWYPVGGGEAGYIAPYPPDPTITFAGDYQGNLTRYDKKTGQLQNVSPWPEVSDGRGAANNVHRFQWTAPLVFSPHDPNVLYHGAEVLFKTTDAGMHWTAISPDLTRNDKSKQQVSGGPINKDDTGTEYYDTIFSIAESPVQKGLIWVGTDDGLIQLTRDGGQHWANVTPKEMPEWSRISLIEASPFDAGAAYAAVERRQLDDLRPYIYKTSDFGASWTKLVSGIPENTFVRAVREDPKKKGLLYAGTETGVFVSFNDGAQWRPLRLNLPTVPIHDLVVKDDDLVLATHGRSFWILDDLTPVRQFAEDIRDSGVHLYTPQTALRVRADKPSKSVVVGQNPPPGAIIDFWLKSEPKGEVKLEVLDSSGSLVRKYSSKELEELEAPLDPESEKPKPLLKPETGLNRVVWDLRYSGVTPVKDYYLFEYHDGARGPFALPGTYQVRLTVDDKVQTARLELKNDPRVQVTQADLDKQFALANQIKSELAKIYDAVNQIEDVREQIRGLHRRLDSRESAKAFLAAADAVDKKALAAQEGLVQLKIKANEDSLAFPIAVDGQLAVLATVVEGADTPPTAASYQVFEKLSKEAEVQITAWRATVTTDLANLQKLATENNLNAVWSPKTD